MESRHSVADGDDATNQSLRSGNPVAGLTCLVLVHPSHLCQIGESDQGYLACWESIRSGKFTSESSGNFSVLDVRYLLPFLIRSQAWVDTVGEFRIGLSQSISLASGLLVYGGSEYDCLTDWKTVAGLEYVVDRRVSLIGQDQ